jgi:hypothetical protein
MSMENPASPLEAEPIPVDISDRVRAIFDNPNQREAMKERIALRRDIAEIQFLNLTLDYTTLDHAKFLKTLLESEPQGGKWTFAIRATESQMKDAANVFASGVEWIPSKS